MKNELYQRLPTYYSGTSYESTELLTLRKQCQPAMAPFPFESGQYLPEVIIRCADSGTVDDRRLRIRRISDGAYMTFGGSENILQVTGYDAFYRDNNETIDSVAHHVLYHCRHGILGEGDYLPCGVYQYVYGETISGIEYIWQSDYWEVKSEEFIDGCTHIQFTCLNSEDPEDTLFCGVDFGVFSDVAPDTAFEFHCFIPNHMMLLEPVFEREVEVSNSGKKALVRSTLRKNYRLSMAQCPVPMAELLYSMQHYVLRPECEVLFRDLGKGYYVKDVEYNSQAYNGPCAPQITLKVQLEEEIVDAGCLDSPADTCPFQPITLVTPEGSEIAVISEYPENGEYEIDCGSSSGILYARPVLSQYDTYANYDIGWYKQNGALDFSEPANPQYIQGLDYTHANWFWMLKHNNAFGNKYRFTNDQGVQATGGKAAFTDADYISGGGTMYYVIDHLTGFGYYVPNIGTFTSWANALNDIKTKHDSGFSGYTGWMPFYRSQVFSLILSKHPYYTSNSNILRRGVVSGVSDTRFMLGETNESNSANAFYFQDNNTLSQAAKSTGGATYIWRKHY